MDPIFTIKFLYMAVGFALGALAAFVLLGNKILDLRVIRNRQAEYINYLNELVDQFNEIRNTSARRASDQPVSLINLGK